MKLRKKDSGPSHLTTLSAISATLNTMYASSVFGRSMRAMEKAEEITQIRKPYLFLFGSFFVLGQLWFGIAAETICTIATIIYPTYRTLLVIEELKDSSNGSNMNESKTHWLMYWIIFCSFKIAVSFLELLRSWFPFFLYALKIASHTLHFASHFIPLYHLAKLVFFLWVLSPYTNGAKKMYDYVIKRALQSCESSVDQLLADAKNMAVLCSQNVLGLEKNGESKHERPVDEKLGANDKSSANHLNDHAATRTKAGKDADKQKGNTEKTPEKSPKKKRQWGGRKLQTSPIQQEQ